MSTWCVYMPQPFVSIISGATYNGVPHGVFKAVIQSTNLDSPKSAILTNLCPSSPSLLNNILSGYT